MNFVMLDGSIEPGCSPGTSPRFQEAMQSLYAAAFMQENGLDDLVRQGAMHHEIYLGDPRRADPAKLKTVLRHPVRKV